MDADESCWLLREAGADTERVSQRDRRQRGIAARTFPLTATPRNLANDFFVFPRWECPSESG